MVENAKELLFITAQAREAARNREFHRVRLLLDKREELMKHADSQGYQSMSKGQTAVVKEIFLCIKEIDGEIKQLVEKEMRKEGNEILVMLKKAKVLSAYRKNLAKGKKFDRKK